MNDITIDEEKKVVLYTLLVKVYSCLSILSALDADSNDRELLSGLKEFSISLRADVSKCLNILDV